MLWHCGFRVSRSLLVGLLVCLRLLVGACRAYSMLLSPAPCAPMTTAAAAKSRTVSAKSAAPAHVSVCAIGRGEPISGADVAGRCGRRTIEDVHAPVRAQQRLLELRTARRGRSDRHNILPQPCRGDGSLSRGASCCLVLPRIASLATCHGLGRVCAGTCLGRVHDQPHAERRAAPRRRAGALHVDHLRTGQCRWPQRHEAHCGAVGATRSPPAHRLPTRLRVRV